MLKSIIKWSLMAILISVLAACGGGGDDKIATSATPLPSVAKAADTSLTQVSTVLTVTPGETFRTALLAVSCPLVQGTIDVCAKAAPLGEIGFEIGLELVNMKVMYNGQEIQGYFNHEGALYRFVPFGHTEMWQTGSIELVSTLSPAAKTGEKSLVVVKVASASFDKTLELKGGETKVEVLALPHYAPAVVKNASPSFIGETKEWGDVASFEYTCPITVSAGCTLGTFDIIVYGAVVGSEMQVWVNDNWYLQAFIDDDGYEQVNLNANSWTPPGNTLTVKVKGAMSANGGVWFGNITSQSGNMKILPALPADCTSASPMYCKG